MMLNSSPRSPLQGEAQMGESVRTEYKCHYQASIISITGLMATLRTLIGQSSPLNSLSPDRRAEVVLLMLAQSRELWPRAWENDNRYMLVSGRGINALLLPITRSPEFRASVGHSFNADSIRRGLEAASSFDWTQAKHRHASTREIVERINQSMIRNHNKQARSN